MSFRQAMIVDNLQYFRCRNKLNKDEEEKELQFSTDHEKVYLPPLPLSLQDAVQLLNDDHQTLGLKHNFGEKLPIVTFPYKGLLVNFFPQNGFYRINCVGISEEFIRDFESETLEVGELEEKQMDDDE